MATNPIQDILQMLMQQGAVGNVPGMQPGVQQASIAPMSPQAQGRDLMPTPRMGSTDQESEDTGTEAGETMTPSDEEFQTPPMFGPERPDVAPDVRAQNRFGPVQDDARDETQGELDRVHEDINSGDIKAIESDLRQAIDDDDQTKVADIIQIMKDSDVSDKSNHTWMRRRILVSGRVIKMQTIGVMNECPRRAS